MNFLYFYSNLNNVYMKFLGMRAGPTKCQCSYCIGKNDSVACRRALKKRGRQHEKKETKRLISKELVD